MITQNPRSGAALVLVVLALTLPAAAQPVPRETKAQRDARMAWWREARFGMFIHWGVYSIPARGEWVMHNEKIPVKEYEKFPPQFNPAKFNAEEWVRLAKEAGMKYIVITSKHHDGFCMWDSKVSSYDIMDATPFKRDVLKELAAACRNEGIRLCFYHSIMDWHHPDATGANFPLYREQYLKPQLKELLTAYGPIGVLWFDGEWIPEWTEEQGRDLYNFCRALQPDLIINNRVGKGRSGMAGMNIDASYVGDFGTPEQEIPSGSSSDFDWESCMTMNDDWGYSAGDTNWKSTKSLIRNLVDIASKGGNYLLNVGPTSEGIIPEPSVVRLKQIDAWMKRNGESIYGSLASPLDSTPWGRCTSKRLPDGGTRLFFHVFDWPEDGILAVHGLGSDPVRVHLISDTIRTVAWKRQEDAILLALPTASPDTDDAVVVAEFKGAVLTFHPPRISAPAPVFLDTLNVSLIPPSNDLEVRYTFNGGVPDAGSTLYEGPLTIVNTTLVRARCFYGGKPVSRVIEQEFAKVAPLPAADRADLLPGLNYAYYEGGWDSIPNFDRMEPAARGIVDTIGLSPRRRDERFGLRLDGYLDVPADGLYLMSLESDDGSVLEVDDSLVVENDGLHGSLEKSGYVPLRRGPHRMRISYFNNLGDKELRLRYALAGEVSRVPTREELFHSR